MPTPRSCRALSRHAPLPIASGALFAGLLLLGSTLVLAAEGGDPQNGARAFRACVACHSLASGQHRTGPSLAGVFGRKAGTAEGFPATPRLSKRRMSFGTGRRSMPG